MPLNRSTSTCKIILISCNKIMRSHKKTTCTRFAIFSVQQVGDNGLDGYTVSKTDCPCNFDTTRGDCACCQNGGCQCDQPHHNQCVRCGSSGQCGAKQWLFGDPAMIGK